MTVRVVIADDHGVLRGGLRVLLNAEPDLSVVGEAVDGEETLRVTSETQPDVVLLDIDLPAPGGIQVARRISESLPSCRVLMLTVHEDEAMLRAAMQAGAAGYVPKRAVESEVINAIRTVCHGEVYVHPSMTHLLLPNRKPSLAVEASSPETLSSRELQVLQLISQGYTNRQIAELLIISVRTVESHRANLMGKLGLHTRVELVRYAREHGFLE